MELIWTYIQSQFARAVIILIAIVSAVGFGHLLTTWTIKLLPNQYKNNDPIGKWIGFLERALIACFVCIGLVKETVFIFAVKSAVISFRLPKEPDVDWRKRKEIAEYMLVGTMASYLWALLFGLIGKSFWGYYSRG